MTNSATTITIPLSEIKITFFVRKETNDDRVLQFAELYEAGTDVPPIEVTAKTYEIVDGRHRKAALELLNRTEAVCVIAPAAPKVELMMRAFGANLGGSLPPTREDIRFFIENLIKDGVQVAHITAMLKKLLPPSVARRYVSDAMSHMSKVNMASATAAVLNGAYKLPEAAQQFGVDPETLKAEITGKRKRVKKFGLSDVKGAMTTAAKSRGSKLADTFRKLRDQYEDGEVTAKQIMGVVDHAHQLHIASSRSLRDWRKRFDELFGKEQPTADTNK